MSGWLDNGLISIYENEKATFWTWCEIQIWQWLKVQRCVLLTYLGMADGIGHMLVGRSQFMCH